MSARKRNLWLDIEDLEVCHGSGVVAYGRQPVKRISSLKTHNISLQQEGISEHHDAICDNAQPCPIISFLIFFGQGDRGSPWGSSLFPAHHAVMGFGVMDEVSLHPGAEKMRLSLHNVTMQL